MGGTVAPKQFGSPSPMGISQPNVLSGGAVNEGVAAANPYTPPPPPQPVAAPAPQAPVYQAPQMQKWNPNEDDSFFYGGRRKYNEL